jgi:exodeoxyribonuclease V gamma subunit
MALTIYRSNRVEVLQARLAQQLAAQPLANPFTTEVIVVPTYAMARWLNLNIARQQGVAANIRYPQAGEWLWSLARAVLPDIPPSDPCDSAALGWSVFNALPGLLETAAFASLRRYLDDDQSGVKRWQLSQRIADCFDRYQSYRPQLIHAWSSGTEEGWQAQLWRSVTGTGLGLHRVEIMRRLRQRLDNAGEIPGLPERISLFALSRLAPAYLEIVNALADRTEVLLFQHNPTDQYWADLVSDKEQARKRLANPRHGDYFDSGNHLLSSWGRQGQALQDMLLDLGPVTAAEIEDNQAPTGASLLHRLQASLFHLEQPQLDPQLDDSISLQLCHSPLRECQVLHDHLLTLLDRHDDLAAEDILVMVPEISRYAPYIEAVFQPDTSKQRPNLAWNISDISVSDGHPLVRMFLQLLQLPGSRFMHSEIMALLECAEIRASFGLDPSMLDHIHRLVDKAQVRWGIDAAQRRALGLPGTHGNTWQQAWERLFAGYAMPGEDLWQQIAPVDEVDSDSGIAIGRFRYLFERLVYWQQRLTPPASASAWQQRLHQLIDEFLAPPSANDEMLLPLREAISELGRSEARDLSSTLVSYWMEKQLATNQQPGRLYSGGISFCGMQPMRNIPFAVICVLGMQDDAFPRRERGTEFDLMRDDPRPGDPRKGDEDRYLMLETLLCARRYLYFSYCARSLKDNSECQPSVLLRELLDYVDSCCATGAGEPPASAQLSRLHPMQAFSPGNFCTASPGYDRYWHDTACLLADRQASEPPGEWPRQALASVGEAESQIDLDRLIRFFQHPTRYFFNARLGMHIPRQQVAADEEAFELQGLGKWALVQQLAQQYLDGEPLELQQYLARGLLPHGTAAETGWFALLSEYRGLLQRLDAFREQQAELRVVECRLDDGHSLYGEVNHCYPGIGLMHFSASKSIKSRDLVSLWLSHLALAASDQLPAQEISQLFAPTTRGWRYEHLDAASARALLRGYVDLFQQSLDYPLPVFPETSFAWARHADPVTAMQKAQTVWNGTGFNTGPRAESTDTFIQLALHKNSTDPLSDAWFQQCARQIYGPAIDHGGDCD